MRLIGNVDEVCYCVLGLDTVDTTHRLLRCYGKMYLITPSNVTGYGGIFLTSHLR